MAHPGEVDCGLVSESESWINGEMFEISSSMVETDTCYVEGTEETGNC